MGKHFAKKHEFLIAVSAFAALAVAFGAPILKHPGNWAIGDWDQFLFYAEAARSAILKYGQFPLWAPNFCGGNLLLANPQSQFMSPSFILVLLFGSLTGMRLKVILYIFIGLLGGYTLGRSLKFRPAAAALCAVVFQLSGIYAGYAANGQQWIIAYPLIPWILACYLNSAKRRSVDNKTAVFLALAWLEGGIYPFPFAVLLLGFLAVIRSAREKKIDHAVSLLAMCAIAFGLGAVKFLPFIDALAGSQRVLPLEAEDIVTLSTLWRMFFSTAAASFTEHYPYFEYYAYIGAIPALLAAASLAKIRETAKWWLLLIVFAVLALGVHSPLPLWQALHSIPLFSSMHVTGRFRMLMMIPVAILAAHTLSRIETSLAQKGAAGKIVPAAILASAALMLFAANSKVLGTGFILSPKPFKPEPEFRQHWKLPEYGSSWSMYPAALANTGTVTCYEYFTTDSIPFSGRLVKFGMVTPAGHAKYHGETFLASGRGEARTVRWTPNALDIETDAAGPDLLIVNQNHDRGWRAEIDGAHVNVVPSDERLISVPVPTGRHVVRLRYAPPMFTAGFALSMIFTAVLLFAGLAELFRRGKHTADA